MLYCHDLQDLLLIGLQCFFILQYFTQEQALLLSAFRCRKLSLSNLLQDKFIIFDLIHQELDARYSQKFPLPKICISATLKKMLIDADGPISLVIDEGNMLAKIPEQDLRILLQLFRSLKHANSKRRSKGLASPILISTEELSNLLKEGDKLISPFSYVKFQPTSITILSSQFPFKGACTLPLQCNILHIALQVTCY